MKTYFLNEQYSKNEYDNFDIIREIIEENRERLYELDINVIILILDQLGKEIINDSFVNNIPGMSYVSIWLRKKNLENICKINLGNINYLNNFNECNNIEISAQPRGIVCHWIAKNVPTIAIFSIVLSMLAKNGNVVKVDESSKEIIFRFFEKLKDIEVSYNNQSYVGTILLDSIAFVTFDSSQGKLNEEFSLIADCKLIWGGESAVRAITALPQKPHCEMIIFGPKYSFGVYDKECIENNTFEKYLERSCTDISLFNQMACSSPHVLFFEKSKLSLENIGDKIKQQFEKLSSKYFGDIQQGIAAKIINSRGEYLLGIDKRAIMPTHLGWTILINQEVCLEEPVHGRCIFIKEVECIEDVLPHVTKKVQTVSLGMLSRTRIQHFAKKLSYLGVARCVAPGKMHDFDTPWDGMFTLNRLVRWPLIKI